MIYSNNIENWKSSFYNDETNSINWDLIENQDWFVSMSKTPQDKIWHSEGDVATHTKMVCESLINLEEFQNLNNNLKHIMVLAALFHDIEKPSTTTVQVIDGKERIVAPRHAQKGEKTIREMMYKENMPFYNRETLCYIIRYHGAPLWSSKDSNFEKKIIKNSLYVNNSLLYMIAKSDVLGRECEDKAQLLENLEFFKMMCQELECYNKPKIFYNKYSRYKYLNKSNIHPLYQGYDDTEFKVYMLSGVAGSGKDTFYKNNYKDLPMVSIDDTRRQMGVDSTDKKGNGRAIQQTIEYCKEHMRDKKSFVFNATNLTKDMRNKWTSLFSSYGGKIIINYIEVPYKTLLKQNNNREDSVPNNIIDKMVSSIEIPRYDESHEINFVI